MLISKECVDKYYFKIDDRKEPTIIPKPVNIVFEETIELEESNVTILEEEQKNIVEELTINQEILEAPKLLLLDDSEKFKDADGNIIEIETRGTKDRKNIYFKVSDVSKGFDMENLNSTLLDTRGCYERKIDYTTFFIRQAFGSTKSSTIKKCLYLTYHGLLRVLFVSKNKNVKRFQDWAEDCLFTIQMGEKKEKIKWQKVSSKIRLT